jgi:putative addiction module antidote
MYEVRLRQIGNSVGVLLPKGLLSELQVKSGDCLYLVRTETGFTASVYNDAYIQQMQAGEKIADQYKNLLRALAKEDEAD